MHISFKNRRRFPALLILVLVVSRLQAQDLYFNQYLLSPTVTNPGMTGTYEDAWVMVNHRTTPLSSGEKINTSQFTALYPISLGEHNLTISGSFYNDRISDSFVTNGGILGAALSIRLTPGSALSFGTQAS
ncbi:MAG: type IX secretion system membrane protein PorP/SprF, partial [Cyclobacteriaceae bacterium]